MDGDVLIRLSIAALEVAQPDVALWFGDAQSTYQLQIQEIIWQLYSELNE